MPPLLLGRNRRFASGKRGMKIEAIFNQRVNAAQRAIARSRRVAASLPRKSYRAL